MPELPEVETVVRTLEKQLGNCTFESVKVLYPKIVVGDNFEKRLENQTIRNYSRRGKFLIFEMDSDTLIVHLRMEGKFYIETPNDPVEKHTHVLFNLKDGRQLRYHDVRKFGRLYLYDKNEPYQCLEQLGLEPWDPALTPEYLMAEYQNLNKPIKSVLLDQSIITGIGNIYANEICFASKLHPMTFASGINLMQCTKIIENTRKILDQAIQAGGTTIRSYTSSLGVNGLFQVSLNVYQKKTCPECGAPLMSLMVQGRNTYFCPKCQKSEQKVYAVTGTIGSGKSTVTELLSEKYFTLSCDAINAELLEKGNKGYIEVKKKFKNCFDENGLNKKKLASLIFNNPEKKELLESILHPLILAEINEQLALHTNESLCFVEVPILFESGWDKYFDGSIAVVCSAETFRKRLKKYRHMSEEEIEERVRQQMDSTIKMQKADFIIENNGTKMQLRKRVNDLVNGLLIK